MADLSSSYSTNSRNNRGRGKEKYKNRKHDSPRKKYDVDNVRSNKDSTSKPYERKYEDRIVHHSSRHWDDGRAGSSYRTNNKPRSSSPTSQRYVQESVTRDFPSSSHSDALVNGQQRSSHDGDRYNDRLTDEPRFVPYNNNNHKSSDENLVAQLKQQVEFFYQENAKLKYDLHRANSLVHDASSLEVNITFRDKDLERHFRPALEELTCGLISQDIRLKDLETFLSSKRNSAENDLPEGELFALDISTSEPNDSSYVPRYETSFSEILQDQDVMNEVDAKKDKPVRAKSCFNCSEDHMIQQCPYQMDYRKIAMAKKQRSQGFASQVRYHVQGMKERDMKPGSISDELREALHLAPDQIPPFIYHMRVLNYPPGWLVEAEVETSGIALYGTDAQTDENKGAGEQNFGSRVQYDPDKLIDFPGFNVPLPPNFIDESEHLCWPPIQDHHLRSVVEQYMPKVEPPKRKRKLTMPDNRTIKVQRLEEDMEVEETLENGSLEFNPPLPDENPPPPPPEDESQPPLPADDSLPPLPDEESLPPLPPNDESLPPLAEEEIFTYIDSDDDDSGTNTPMSNSIMEALAPVVERFNLQKKVSTPSLKELEEIKKQLVMELEDNSNGSSSTIILSDSEEPSQNSNDVSSLGSASQTTSRQVSKTESFSEAQPSSRQISMTESQDSGSEDQISSKQVSTIDSQNSGFKNQTSAKQVSMIDGQDSGSETQTSSKQVSTIDIQITGSVASTSPRQVSMIDSQANGSEAQMSSKKISTIDSQNTGSVASTSSRQVSMTESQDSGSEVQISSSQLSRTWSGSKLVSLGTPSLSRHSSFKKLPEYDNFSKNVTSHLNFENLPNSVGTYQKMKKVIKKVKEKINAFMQ